MKIYRKILSLALVWILLLASFMPAMAYGAVLQSEAEQSDGNPPQVTVLTVDPARELYQGGEKIQLQVHFIENEAPVVSGIKWSWAKDEQAAGWQKLDEDSNEILFTLPDNKTEDVFNLKFLAEYGDQSQQVKIMVSPSLKTPSNVATPPAIAIPLVQMNSVTELSLSSSNENNMVNMNQTLQLKAVNQDSQEISPADLDWSSQVPGIATVDEQGLVKGLVAGIVYIEAALKSNPEVKNKIKVTVGTTLTPPLAILVKTPANGATNVDPNAEISLLYNQPITVMDTLSHTPTENKGVYLYLYNSAGSAGLIPHQGSAGKVDENVLNKLIFNLKDVDGNNLINPLNKTYGIKVAKGAVKDQRGTDSALLKYQDWTFTIDTSLAQAVPKTIMLSGSSDRRLLVGDTLALTAVIKNQEGKVLAVPLNWKVDQSNLATVDSSGKVTGQAPGNVKVTAVVDGYPSVKAEILLEIRASFPQKLSSLWTYPFDKSKQGEGKPAIKADGSSYTFLLKKSIANIMYGSILALNPDGTAKQSFNSPEISQPPVTVNWNTRDYLLTSNAKSFLALDSETGEPVCQVELPANIVSIASVGQGGSIYLAGQDNTLYAVSLAEQRVVWHYGVSEEILKYANDTSPLYGNPDNELYSAPAIDQSGRVYLVAGKTLSVLDGDTGDLLWQYTAGNTLKTQALVDQAGGVYLVDTGNVIYGLAAQTAGSQTVQARWSKNYPDPGIFAPVLASDGVLITSAGHLHKLNPETGELLTTYLLDGPGAQIGADGLIYTTKVIYNSEGVPIAYYDDPSLDFPTDFRYSDFSLDGNGILYRAIRPGHTSKQFDGIEAVRIYDLSHSTPHKLSVQQTDITLYPGESSRPQVRVLDENGVSLPGILLDWSSSAGQIVSVDAQGLVTALQVGEAAITVKVANSSEPSLTQEIKVQVRAKPEIKKMVFVYDMNSYPSNKLTDYSLVGGGISAVKGEAFKGIRVFVADQHDEFVPKEQIVWELVSQGGDVAMLSSAAGSGDYDIRYGATLTGKAVGTAILRAGLANHPEIKCELTLEVLPAPYTILWQLPLDGGYGNKTAALATGHSGELYYVNENKLKAIKQADQSPLWVSDPGSYYGIMLGTPQVDEDGTIYLSATDSTAVVAVDHQTGKILWGFTRAKDPIQALAFAKDYVYALSQGGYIYKLDKAKGTLQWDKPFAAGSTVTGLAVSATDQVYYAAGSSVYTLSPTQEKAPLYTESGAVLSLEALSSQGNLIVQRKKSSSFALLSLAAIPQVQPQWSYALPEQVVLSLGREGGIYAVSAPGDTLVKRAYFLNSDGKVKVDGQIFYTAENTSNTRGIYKPIIGSQGQVYIPTVGLCVLDQETGALLWKEEIKDTYSIQVPASVAVNQEGIIYLSMGEMGLVAIQGADQAAGPGLKLNVSGAGNLRLDCLQNLEVKVINNTEQVQKILLRISLCETSKNQVTSYSSTNDTLASKTSKVYPGSVRIPATGSYQVKVEVLDSSTRTILQELTLPVNGF